MNKSPAEPQYPRRSFNRTRDTQGLQLKEITKSGQEHRSSVKPVVLSGHAQ